ncbi:MAG: DUF202 domain-containing protein [Gemmataceae bacterium]
MVEENADPRVDLALRRTEWALERTQLAWVRTAFVMMTAGLGFAKTAFALSEAKLLKEPRWVEYANQGGIGLSALSAVLLALATWAYVHRTNELNRMASPPNRSLPTVLPLSLLVIAMGATFTILLLFFE